MVTVLQLSSLDRGVCSAECHCGISCLFMYLNQLTSLLFVLNASAVLSFRFIIHLTLEMIKLTL